MLRTSEKRFWLNTIEVPLSRLHDDQRCKMTTRSAAMSVEYRSLKALMTHLGHRCGSSALPSNATATSIPLALTNKGPNGMFSMLEAPSIRSNQDEFESWNVSGLMDWNGYGGMQGWFSLILYSTFRNKHGGHTFGQFATSS